MSHRTPFFDPYDPLNSAGISRQLQANAQRDTEQALKEWIDYCKKLEDHVRGLGAVAIAESELVGEILDEVEGIKPKRLSDPANKHLRDAFREDKKKSFRLRNAGRKALQLDLAVPPSKKPGK